MRTIAEFCPYTASPAFGEGTRPVPGLRAAGAVTPAGVGQVRSCRPRCGKPLRAVPRDYALPYGSAGTRLPGSSSADSPVPAAGDWLSGRAPRSHRGGHWFDPSIAHQLTGQLRSCNWPFLMPVQHRSTATGLSAVPGNAGPMVSLVASCTGAAQHPRRVHDDRGDNADPQPGMDPGLVPEEHLPGRAGRRDHDDEEDQEEGVGVRV